MELTTTLITVGGVIVSAIISAVSSMALVNWRLASLEKKVDEHNSWGDKFSELTTDMALTRRDIEYIKERLNDGKNS